MAKWTFHKNKTVSAGIRCPPILMGSAMPDDDNNDYDGDNDGPDNGDDDDDDNDNDNRRTPLFSSLSCHR